MTNDEPLSLVARELPADLDTPVSAYLKLRRAGEAGFLLESVAGGERVARYSFLGVGASHRLDLLGDDWTYDGRAESETTSPLARLRRELAPRPVAADRSLPPFRGGAVGFLSWDFVRRLERLPNAPPDSLGLPDASFHRFDAVVAFDHVRQVMVLIAAETDTVRAEERLEELERRLRGPLPAAERSVVLEEPLASNFRPRDFEAAVAEAKEYIAAGDAFQIVLSQRWSARFAGDPFESYRRLRRIDPSPYMVFLENEHLSLAAASPEMLVRVVDGRAETHPIAGTRPRSGDDEEDSRRERELLADPKENAEHVMLVDLGRNDLGRVARAGSVRVERFREIERYRHVSHIVSRVVADVRDGVAPLEVLFAAFPAGTVSGAPKVRAIEIIDELEPERRGPYAGAVAYVDAGGNLDSCITIRSLLFERGRVHLQAGAGIVADSDPRREREETIAKSRALRRALGAEDAE